MTMGSKVFRPTDVPESNSSNYPGPFRERHRRVQLPPFAPARHENTSPATHARSDPMSSLSQSATKTLSKWLMRSGQPLARP